MASSPSAEAQRQAAQQLLTKPTRATSSRSLWASYGTLSFHAPELVLKCITSPSSTSYSESSARKMLSYHIEANFYAHFSTSLPAQIAVPVYLTRTQDPLRLVLADIRPQYPVLGEKRGTLSEAQLDTALVWLVSFHEHFKDTSVEQPCPTPELAMKQEWKGDGLWERGGYSYLSTRQEELDSISSSSPFSRFRRATPRGTLASALDRYLSASSGASSIPATLVHGDFKAANLAFSRDGSRCCAFDFQYVGRGRGVCDLVKLLQSSAPPHLLTLDGEKQIVARYASLRGHALEQIWEEWEVALLDWTRFLAGWGMWGNDEWLTARAEEILARKGWVESFMERHGTQE